MRGGQLLISLVGIGLLVGGLWLSPVRAEAGVQSGGNLSCLVTEACTTPDCITHGELATER